MEDWPCFQIPQATKTAKIKLQEVLWCVDWRGFQDVPIPSRLGKCFESQWTIPDLLNSRPHPLCTLIFYTTSHNKALPFNTNTAHMMHMDSLANRRYHRCCNCAIKTGKRNTHPYDHFIWTLSVTFSLGYSLTLLPYLAVSCTIMYELDMNTDWNKYSQCICSM